MVTVFPEIVITLSNMHLPAGQFAWNTMFFPYTVVVAPPGATISKGLLVTINGAELLVNDPFTELAMT
jgi:hypothetical protein